MRGAAGGWRSGRRCPFAPLATEETDQRQAEGIRCMEGTNGTGVLEVAAYGLFQLKFRGISVPGEDLLGFPHRDLDAAQTGAKRGEHDHSGNLAERDS